MGQVIHLQTFKNTGAIMSPSDVCHHTMVREFNEKVGASKDPELWLSLIKEETEELAEAAASLLKELTDLEYVVIGAIQNGVDMVDKTTVDNMNNLSKWRQMVHPAIMDEVFRRVHQSNMSKLNDKGVPEYREDGKILKGVNYKEPYLYDLV